MNQKQTPGTTMSQNAADAVEKHDKFESKSTVVTDNESSNLEEVCNEEVKKKVRAMEQVLLGAYDFRFNILFDQSEFKPKDRDAFQPVSKRDIGDMTLMMRRMGLDVRERDVKGLLQSRTLEQFNPVTAYLDKVRGKWDGRDRIGELASTLKCTNPKVLPWFHRWFLAMVAQWMGMSNEYANAVAPILIGKQGTHKSTFCKRLLPKELAFGYNDSCDFSNKRSTEYLLGYYLLVNLDEYNQLTARQQSGFVKNLMQKTRVSVRKLFTDYVTQRPRYTSFIGTSNQKDIISDPTGSRRLICIELTESIDTSYELEYEQLYSQAVHEIENGERYWFDEADVAEIMQSNTEFKALNPTQELFFKHFRVAGEGDTNKLKLSATEIYEMMTQRSRKHIPYGKIIHLGRFLKSLQNMHSVYGDSGIRYEVVKVA